MFSVRGSSPSVSFTKLLLVLGPEWVMKSSITAFWSLLSPLLRLFSRKAVCRHSCDTLAALPQETQPPVSAQGTVLAVPLQAACSLPSLPASSGKGLGEGSSKESSSLAALAGGAPRQLRGEASLPTLCLEAAFPECYTPTP